MSTEQFGVHLLFDGYQCDPEKLSNKKYLESLLKELPAKMGMHPICPEIVVEVGEQNEKDPGGISGFVMIAESHISFHTFPARRFISADIYTCQNDLDEETFTTYLGEAFGCKDFDSSVIPRGLRYPANNVV